MSRTEYRFDGLDALEQQLSRMIEEEYHKLDLLPLGDPLRRGSVYGDPRLYALAGQEGV